MESERLSEQELINKHLKESDTALAVGLYYDPYHDPSGAHLCTRVKKSAGGKVIFLDFQIGVKTNEALRKKFYRRIAKKIPSPTNPTKTIRSQTLEKWAKSTKTAGDLSNYRRELRRFFKLRKKLEGIEWTPPNLHIANALNNRLPDQSIDFILDRGTATQIATRGYSWLHKVGDLDVGVSRSQKWRLGRLVNEYLRVLRPGGKIIFFLKPPFYQDPFTGAQLPTPIESGALAEIKKSLLKKNVVVETHEIASTIEEPYVFGKKSGNIFLDDSITGEHSYNYALVVHKPKI